MNCCESLGFLLVKYICSALLVLLPWLDCFGTCVILVPIPPLWGKLSPFMLSEVAKVF